MSGFTTCDSIKVLTQNGECEIELCLGDITKLSNEDKVDVLMISAFLGDYAPTPTSVIGALKRNLGLSVRDLARDKEEDLRELYSCWWSKPLPSHLPYNRLLCFETKSFSSSPPQVMISDAFRCLVPILKNEDGSVITPLLNTGDQGYGKDVMIKGMIEAAVRWMKAGLPLRKLKIVLYARSIEGKSKDVARASGYSLTLEAFERMKEKYDMQYMIPKEVEVKYDIYLSYSDVDKSFVENIQEKLKKTKEDVRIFSTRQQLNENSFWQEEIYDVMMKSARVITILTPNYLQTTACLEQYNIALCCNRKAHRDMLAPFYAVTIENMPTYMGLVQYVDCRSQEKDSISNACNQIIISLSNNLTNSLSITNDSVVQYDLFLSYCHKDTEIAQKIVKILQDLKPDLKIFFDVEELKTGKSWQRALYHSIDGSRCLVALMTNNYIRSAVCQEEFNLSMMKHYAMKNRLQLIPFAIEEISYLPPGFKNISQISTNAENLGDDIRTLCLSLVTWLDTGTISEDSTYHKYFVNPKDVSFHIGDKWETLRRNRFEGKFNNAQHKLRRYDFPPAFTDAFDKGEKHSIEDSCDIVLSYNEHDEIYADYIMKVLQQFAPKLSIKTKGANEQERLTRIEKTKKIVPLLSPSYIESPEQVEELHIAIWRSRVSPNLMFPIHLHTLPSRPAYFHLLPCPVNLNDSLWTELAVKEGVTLPAKVNEVVEHLSKTSEQIALYMAVYYLLEAIEREGHESTPPSSSPSPKPALLNPFCLERNVKDLDSDMNEQVPDPITTHSENANSDMNSTSKPTSEAVTIKPKDEGSDINKAQTGHAGTDVATELNSNVSPVNAQNKVREENIPQFDTEVASELTSNAVLENANLKVSGANRPQFETDVSSPVTSNTALEKNEDSDTSKSQTPFDVVSEPTTNAAVDRAKKEVNDESTSLSGMDITSAETNNSTVDKKEDKINESNKPLPLNEITKEGKDVHEKNVKEDAAQDLLARKVDETIEPSPDERNKMKSKWGSSSWKLRRGSGKKRKRRMCNLI